MNAHGPRMFEDEGDMFLRHVYPATHYHIPERRNPRNNHSDAFQNCQEHSRFLNAHLSVGV